MMDFLQFMFSGFWTFIGMLILIGGFGELIVEAIRALRK